LVVDPQAKPYKVGKKTINERNEKLREKELMNINQ
jgi:hypothetical protein